MSENMLGVALCDVRGLLNDLMEKLCGPEGKTWLGELKKFLRREPLWVTRETDKSFMTFRRLKIGTIFTGEAFCQVFRNKKMHMSKDAKDTLCKTAFRPSDIETEVELVCVSGIELGFKCTITLKCLFERAAIFGLEPCLAEIGPHLRLQYTNQPRKEQLLIAMQPIADSYGNFKIFKVCRGSGGGKGWLDCSDVCVSHCYPPEHNWIFQRCRK